ncbi:hypothetical protein DFH07DRAFT_1058435, partial [Mycena maculata]
NSESALSATVSAVLLNLGLDFRKKRCPRPQRLSPPARPHWTRHVVCFRGCQTASERGPTLRPHIQGYPAATNKITTDKRYKSCLCVRSPAAGVIRYPRCCPIANYETGCVLSGISATSFYIAFPRHIQAPSSRGSILQSLGVDPWRLSSALARIFGSPRDLTRCGRITVSDVPTTRSFTAKVRTCAHRPRAAARIHSQHSTPPRAPAARTSAPSSALKLNSPGTTLLCVVAIGARVRRRSRSPSAAPQVFLPVVKHLCRRSHP